MAIAFVSYSSANREAAEEICAYLERRGISCWIAPRDVRPGADYAEEIANAIDRSAALVLVLSARANVSRHVRNEVDRAVSRGKAILPVRIEDVPLSKAIELLIASYQWVDAYIPPLEARLEGLANAIQGLLGGVGSADGRPPACSGHQVAGPAAGGSSPSPGPGAVAAGGPPREGVITGNRVFVRSGPTVAAKSQGVLNQGDTVAVLAEVTLQATRECLLKQDVEFVPRHGTPYVLEAGRGLVISGETVDSYRVEITRSQGPDIGFVPKVAVILMDPALWYKVKTDWVEGWVYSRYVRLF